MVDLEVVVLSMLILPGKIYGIRGVDFHSLSPGLQYLWSSSVMTIVGKVPSRPNFKNGKVCFHISNVCQVCMLVLFICVSSFEIPVPFQISQ